VCFRVAGGKEHIFYLCIKKTEHSFESLDANQISTPIQIFQNQIVVICYFDSMTNEVEDDGWKLEGSDEVLSCSQIEFINYTILTWF